MRELIYAVEGKAANLLTFAMDEPGHGGACHQYGVVAPNKHESLLAQIDFQNGPINAGVNGIQHEDLLAILIDRLEGFQRGAYACPENACALLACKEALGALNFRTKTRMARKVEGTHTV